MSIMTLKRCLKAGAVMPSMTSGVGMLTLSRLTAEFSRRRGSAGKYEPCFIRASVTAMWETERKGASLSSTLFIVRPKPCRTQATLTHPGKLPGEITQPPHPFPGSLCLRLTLLTIRKFSLMSKAPLL